MTTTDLFLTVLSEYGYATGLTGIKVRATRNSDTVYHYADIVVKNDSTTIQLFGATGKNASKVVYDFGKIRVSENQLRSLLTVISENHN